MKTETLMWLLPVVFMLHDLEEIIMLRPWLKHNAGPFQRRFPRMASRLLPRFEKLSTLSFAFAVAEIFLLLSTVTYVTVEWNLYSVWAGIMLAFFLHLIVHIVQYAAYRRYTPAILTSVLGSVYCLSALYAMSAWSDLSWSQVVFWTLLMVPVGVANLLTALRVALHFEKYLNEKFS